VAGAAAAGAEVGAAATVAAGDIVALVGVIVAAGVIAVAGVQPQSWAASLLARSSGPPSRGRAITAGATTAAATDMALGMALGPCSAAAITATDDTRLSR
jgi:hypothetical protein